MDARDERRPGRAVQAALVPVRDGKIIELNEQEAIELTGFIMGKTMSEDKQMKEMLQKAGKQ